MESQNLFQVFSQVFIESQQAFTKTESELRSRCRVMAQKLNNIVEDIEKDVFEAKISNVFDLEEDFTDIVKLSQELQKRRSFIKDSVSNLKKSTEKHTTRLT